MINNIYKNCNIPPSDLSTDGELKLASFYSSGVSCSALGRLDLVHQEGNLRPTGSVEVPHALSGVHNLPPPPHSIKSHTNNLKSSFFLIFCKFFLYAWIQCRKNPALVYTFVECGVPQGTAHKVRFHTVILHRAE